MTPMKKALMALAIVGIVIAAGYFVYVMYVPIDDGGDDPGPLYPLGWATPGHPAYIRVIYEPGQNLGGFYYYTSYTNLKTGIKTTQSYTLFTGTPGALLTLYTQGEITKSQYDCGKAQYDATLDYPVGWNTPNTINHICITNTFNDNANSWSISWSVHLSPYYNYRLGGAANADGVKAIVDTIYLVNHTMSKVQYDCAMAQIATLSN
jgi:hypothetical protein